MKSLHKKISAVVLAGMIVVGGFAASGVSAHAYYMGDISKLSRGVQYSYQEVVDICKENGIKIFAVSNSNELLEKYIREEYEKVDKNGKRIGLFKRQSVVDRLLKGYQVPYGEAYSLGFLLRLNKQLNGRLYGKGVHRIAVGQLQYLIYVK